MNPSYPQTIGTSTPASAYLATCPAPLRIPASQASPLRPAPPHRLGSDLAGALPSGHSHPAHAYSAASAAASQRLTRVSTWRDAVVPHLALRADAASAAALGLRVDACPTPGAGYGAGIGARHRSASGSSGSGSTSGASRVAGSPASMHASEADGDVGAEADQHVLAPQLPTRGSTFSIPSGPSRSASTGSDVWGATPQAQSGARAPLARTSSASLAARATSVPASEVPHRHAAPSCPQRWPTGHTPNQSQSQNQSPAPCLGRQQADQQKKVMAEKMVDAVHDLLCSTWSSASDASSFSSARSSASDESLAGAATLSPVCSSTALVPLRIFIREILRRSKSSCGTLRCAEWYLKKLRGKLIPAYADESDAAAPSASHTALPSDSPLLCPRRAFLAALVLSHKFLHDRVYSNRAWAKVSELDVREISRAELALATALDWNLWVGRQDQVEALRADAASAVPAPGGSASSSVAREQVCTSTDDVPATITSWRAGVRQPTSSPESLSPAAMHCGGPGLGLIVSVSPEGMDKPADSSAPHGLAPLLEVSSASTSPEPAQAGHLSGSRSAFFLSQGSSCTILSSCLPGLTLDGRSDWDGSVSAAGISPNSWVMVTGATPDVQIVSGGDAAMEDGRPAAAAVCNEGGSSSSGVNHKKRVSPLAAELLARDAQENACAHSWEAQVPKRRRVTGSGEA